MITKKDIGFTTRIILAIRSYSWYYPTVITVVLVVGILSTAYTYVRVTSSVKQSLLEQASTVAFALEPREITTLTGTGADLQNPDYLALKERLVKVRESNQDIRFVYLTGYRDGNPFFYVDSEPENSPDYSPPGQIYFEGDFNFRNPFINNNSKPILEDISSDRWGTWLTAVTPIVDQKTNKVVALMGMDMNASIYYQMVFAYSALPAVATGFVIILIFIGFVIRKREQERMRFQSEVVSIASHEIRSPLNGIRWSLETLLKTDRQNLSGEQMSTLGAIKESCDKLLMTVKGFLDITAIENSRIKKSQWQKVDIIEILRVIIKDLELVAGEKNINLVLDSSFSAPAYTHGDKDKLKLMFANIISNAIKYSKTDADVTIGLNQKEKMNQFWIKDKGIGISQKDKSHIFDGFFRTENAKIFTDSGTGLGLYYSKQVAEVHNGKIWFESEENQGTTFLVELPKI